MSNEGGAVAVPHQDDEGQLEMWKEMVAVERERIASRDRATDVMDKTYRQAEC